jgi:hypothetical protein
MKCLFTNGIGGCACEIGHVPTRQETGRRGAKGGPETDLRDDRQGAYDPVGNRTKRNTSEATTHERLQPGAAMQGDSLPTKDFQQLAEGLKRQRKRSAGA